MNHSYKKCLVLKLFYSYKITNNMKYYIVELTMTMVQPLNDIWKFLQFSHMVKIEISIQ